MFCSSKKKDTSKLTGVYQVHYILHLWSWRDFHMWLIAYLLKLKLFFEKKLFHLACFQLVQSIDFNLGLKTILDSLSVRYDNLFGVSACTNKPAGLCREWGFQVYICQMMKLTINWWHERNVHDLDSECPWDSIRLLMLYRGLEAAEIRNNDLWGKYLCGKFTWASGCSFLSTHTHTETHLRTWICLCSFSLRNEVFVLVKLTLVFSFKKGILFIYFVCYATSMRQGIL